MGLSKLITCFGTSCKSAPKSPDALSSQKDALADSIPEAQTITVAPTGISNESDANPVDAVESLKVESSNTPCDKPTSTNIGVPAHGKAGAAKACNASADSPTAKAPQAWEMAKGTESEKIGPEPKDAPAEGVADKAEHEEGDEKEESGVDTNFILEVFGFEVLQKLQGKMWDERGQAVQLVRTRVAQNEPGNASLEDFFRASCMVAQMALKDKVMPVYLDALELAKLLLGELCKSADTLQGLASEGVHTLVPIIVAKSSDRNARSMEGTHAALVLFAKQPLVGCQPVMTHMLMPIASAREVNAIRGRLDLISVFIKEFGFSKSSGMSLSAVMTFVRPHLDAAHEQVRRTAVEVTVQCYQIKGERTRKFCTNLMPSLQKLLEQRFAEADGGKTETVKPRAGGKLPALRGSRKGRPLGSTGTPTSRGSSRNSSSAGSIGSLGKHIGMPQPLEGIKEPSSQRATPKNLVIAEEPVMRSDPFGSPDEDCAGQNPHFIPSPIGEADDPLFSADEETFMREIESF